ncbi:MAG TPA: transglutaminase-like domain-containing protein [Lacipirellulaceae bacterium]|nr:transglutaminase-like domain-containing protein [Lacipirellulaceae bacterium]
MILPSPAYCRPAAFRAFAESLPQADTPAGLFRAAWAIAQHEQPEANLAAGETVIANLAEAVRRRVRSRSQEALMAHMHDVLFDVIGFRGNGDDYYSPSNSLLPDVLRTRRGLPITLTLVYRCVAAGVGLTVHGINSPGHFLAEVEWEETTGRRSAYVDPFYGGDLLHEGEVLARIAEATGHEVTLTPELLQRATPRQWLARILHNLQASLAAGGRERDMIAMQELESLLGT